MSSPVAALLAAGFLAVAYLLILRIRGSGPGIAGSLGFGSRV
jgi:hypothetical protein